jgi:hypothetical protein
MRKIVLAASIFSLLFLAIPASFAAPAHAPKTGPGMIVIVFKDGHRQSFNLSDIAHIEFPANAVEAADATANAVTPPRHFLGKWECGDGSGSTFYITLQENGDAMRSIGNVHGKWVYADGEARITWDDGAEDAIRKVGSRYQKFAYTSGKFFTGIPANVTDARNTTPHPI